MLFRSRQLPQAIAQTSAHINIPHSSASQSASSSTGTGQSAIQPSTSTAPAVLNIPSRSSTKRAGRPTAGSGAPIPLILQRAGRFYCTLCSSHFGRKDNLVAHMKKLHSGHQRLQFTCTRCNKTFITLKSHNEHVAAAHTNVYLYFCHKCAKGFFHESSLSKHRTKENCADPDDDDADDVEDIVELDDN